MSPEEVEDALTNFIANEYDTNADGARACAKRYLDARGLAGSIVEGFDVEDAAEAAYTYYWAE